MTTLTEKLDDLEAKAQAAGLNTPQGDRYAEEGRDILLAAVKEKGFTDADAKKAGLASQYSTEFMGLFSGLHKLYVTTGWEPLTEPLLMGMSWLREAADLGERMDASIFGEKRPASGKGFFSVFKPGTTELGTTLLESMAHGVVKNSGPKTPRGKFALLDHIAKLGAETALTGGEHNGTMPKLTSATPAQLFAFNIPGVAASFTELVAEFTKLSMHGGAEQLMFAVRDLLGSMNALAEDGAKLNTYVGTDAFFAYKNPSQADGVKLVMSQLDKLARGEEITEDDNTTAVAMAVRLTKERMEN